jgi:hypothetical protein
MPNTLRYLNSKERSCRRDPLERGLSSTVLETISRLGINLLYRASFTHKPPYSAKAVNLRLMILCIYVGVATSPVRKELQVPADIYGRDV